MATAIAGSEQRNRQKYDEIFAGICGEINDAVDESPFGSLAVDIKDGGHDSQFRCDAARKWLSEQGVSDGEIISLLQALLKSGFLKTRREKLVANNLIAIRAIELKDYEAGLHHASEGFSHWQHDIYNHRLVLQCKSRLGAGAQHHEQELADYLDRTYCSRPFEHFETTFDKKVYLCSPDYLTPPAADLTPLLRGDPKAKIDPASLDEVAWNSPQAQHIRRSIIGGEYKYCSPLTCPLIQGRLLPQRKLDVLPAHLDAKLPYEIERGYEGYSIYYLRSRVYAVPTGQPVGSGTLSENVLVSYTLADLQGQISHRLERTLRPIDRRWFQENQLEQSVVLTLAEPDPQGRLKQRMDKSPRELMMTHDNSCNISCPSCRTHTIIANRKQTNEYDRLVPVFLSLVKDADRLIVSGAGDAFASKHFRRLLRAIAGKENEIYGTVPVPPSFRINLMTNGLLFTPETYEEFGLAGRIGIVALSMDSCEPESFEVIRRGSKWEDLLKALEFIKTIRAENEDFVLISYFTVQEANFRQIPKFIDFCRSHNFQHVQLNMIRNFGSLSQEEFALANIGDPAHPQFEEFLEVMRSPMLADPFLILGNAKDYRELAIEKERKTRTVARPGHSGFCGELVPYVEGLKTFERTYGNTRSVLKQSVECGHTTFDPLPTDEELNRHYENAGLNIAAAFDDLECEYARPELTVVAQHLIETVREYGCGAAQLEAHDYGCAMGSLVYALQQAGVNATGHDINSEWVDAAAKFLGDRMSSEPFEDIFSESARKLHLVTMLHVLDYMPRPLDAMRAVRAQLADSGIVYLCVSNGLNLVREVLGVERDDNFTSPTHLHNFTPRSLERLMQAAHMRLLHLETRPSHLSEGGRTTLFKAAKKVGLRGEESAILARVAEEFQTAELFAIACRDDSPAPWNRELAARIAARATERPLWQRLDQAVAAIDPLQKVVICSQERLTPPLGWSTTMNGWIAAERVSFRVFPKTETPKSVAAFLANAAGLNLRVLFVSNGGTKLASLLSQHQGATVVPKGPWPAQAQTAGSAVVERFSNRWTRRFVSRMKRKSYVPHFLRRSA